MMPNSTGKLFKMSMLLTLICLALSHDIFGQATNASISGIVKDDSGAPLPGATVRVQNTSTGFETGTITNVNGEFILRQLPLGGPYNISSSFIGFQENQKSGIMLNQGKSVKIGFAMSNSSTELQEVIVTGDALSSRIDELGEVTSIGFREIKNLPTEGRNFTRLTALSPLQGGGSLNLGGQRRTSTGVTIDGVNARNTLTAGEIGRGPYTISQEAVREFQVNTNDYDVTSGRFAGGAIQATTKSGTNTPEASVFFYNRSDALQSQYDIRANDRAEDFNTNQYGVSVGGPIVKDKVHFYAVYETQREDLSQNIGNIRDGQAGVDDQNRLRISRDSLNEFINIARQSYGLSDALMVGIFDRKTEANTLFARIDWQIDDKNRLTLRNNYNKWESPLSVSDNSNLELRESWSDFTSQENSFLVSLRSAFTPNLMNEFKVQYQRAKRDFLPSGGFIPEQNIPRAVVNVTSTTPDGRTSTRSVQIGGQRFTPETNLERQVHFTNTTYINSGKFNFTFGTDNQITYLETLLSSEQNGRFTFQSLDDFRNLAPSRYLREAPLQGRPIVEQTVVDLSLFAQVDFFPHPDINLIAGIRWDATAFLEDAENNPLVEQELGFRTDVKPQDWDNFQPRIQATWNYKGRNSDIIKVGGGVFNAQPHYYAQVNNIQNSGTLIQSVDVSGDLVPTPNFPAYREDPSTVPGAEINAENNLTTFATINAVDPDFEVPTTFKGNISYTHFFGNRYSLGFNFLASKTVNNYVYQETNIVDEPFFVTPTEGREVFVPASTINESNGATDWTQGRKSNSVGRTLVLTPDGELETFALVLQGSARIGKDGEVSASYTFNQAKDNSSYNCCVANTSTFLHVDGDPRDLKWGYSDNHFSNKLVINGTSPSWKGFNLGVTVLGYGGEVFTFRTETNTSANGDFNLSNDAAYIWDPNNPETPAEIVETYNSILADPEVTDNFKDYLRDNFGQFAERNGGRDEFYATVDMRITKKFNLPNTGHGLELSADLFNVANFWSDVIRRGVFGNEMTQNAVYGKRNDYGRNIDLMRITGFDRDTNSYQYRVQDGVTNPDLRGTPWRLQLGIRYTFN
ncbi:carboxypeptidase regulatory-like domain-containing protein [Fulvivirga sp. M361]|uniref:TonB-dependent receptor n=1 Tax=Fulvivirga sp. M361 TaxID=2594266 RepID=UPI00117B5902|nr:carboxypeptidase-like regulatory domain-containing protein [Fulvivirga sp. M361]TRX58349.1 carboxypeptidase regulatory-like domain-containing protein [Fulvivirga sp. M361]